MGRLAVVCVGTLILVLSGLVPGSVGAPPRPMAPPPALLPAGGRVVNLSAADWAPVSAPNPPPGSWGASMAYDTAARDVILFGGCEIAVCPSNDTWAFSKGIWTNVTKPAGPSPRWNAMMASDPAAGGVLLFGGCGLGTCYLNDTWLYRAGNWSNVTKGAAPSGRAGGSAAWYPAGNEVLLFGGCELGAPNVSSCAGNDTWRFSAGSWSRIVTPIGATPPAREYGTLATEGMTGEVVLQGGSAYYAGARAHTTIFNDTWQYRGALGWQESGTGLQPIRAYSPSAAWDNGTSSVVLFGGFNGYPNNTVYGSTFSFSGSSWTNVSPVISPPDRYAASVAYDLADRELLLFGGISPEVATFNDTWVLTIAGYPPPSAAPISGQVDVGQSVIFTAPPASMLPNATYFWTGLPGCPTRDTRALGCKATFAGRVLVQVNVSFPNGSAGTSAPLAYVVDPALTVAFPRSTPVAANVGQLFAFSVQPGGGTGTYRFVWTNLPTGCASANSSMLNCTPTGSGNSAPRVNVTDTNGASAVGVLPSVVVHPALSATLIATSFNGSFSLRAVVSGGTAPFRFSYQGLPANCPSANATNLSCSVGASGGTWRVTLTVVDATGSATNSSANVTVRSTGTGNSSPNRFTGLPWWGYLVAGALGAVLVAALVIRLRRSRPGEAGPAPEETPPPEDPGS